MRKKTIAPARPNRATIRLTDAEYNDLLALAAERAEPVADTLRLALRYYISERLVVNALNTMVETTDDFYSAHSEHQKQIEAKIDALIRNANQQNQKLATLESVFSKAR